MDSMRKIIPVLSLSLFCMAAYSAEIISGYISDGNTPIDSARVRIQGESNFVYTNSNGKFIIYSDLPSGTWISVAAGKQDWYSADRNAMVGDTTVQITLTALPESDNMNYEFKDPEYCNTCHTPLVEQWKQSKHSGAAKNKMVLQLLNGTDVHGNPGVAPGFKLDNPLLGGDCADCHAPTLAQFEPGNTDLNDVLALGAVDTNGVFCDFCHKVQDVTVNYERGINGSIILKRPSANDARDINFGALDDVTTFWMGATYSPVQGKSDFCSACHQYANDNGVIVDDTYDSWAVSDYAEAGIKCQDCHMKPYTDSVFVSGIGLVDAIKRDPSRLYNHLFRRFGTTDSSETAGMDISAALNKDTLFVNAAITNLKAGHKLPTGVSLRNMIFVVEIKNGSGEITQIYGDTLPPFAGIGPVEERNFSGFPGRAFALVTYDSTKKEWPVGNWAATGILYDSRIPAGATDKSSYKFLIDPEQRVTVKTELLYRAVYKHWANAKGWDTREYIMADTLIQLGPETAINEYSAIPALFALSQNYPNPFNAVTRFNYSLSENAQIKLNIYDLSGKLVKKLVNNIQNAGTYSVTLNANNLASGIYIARLDISQTSAIPYSISRKILLIK